MVELSFPAVRAAQGDAFALQATSSQGKDAARQLKAASHRLTRQHTLFEGAVLSPGTE